MLQDLQFDLQSQNFITLVVVLVGFLAFSLFVMYELRDRKDLPEFKDIVMPRIIEK